MFTYVTWSRSLSSGKNGHERHLKYVQSPIVNVMCLGLPLVQVFRFCTHGRTKAFAIIVHPPFSRAQCSTHTSFYCLLEGNEDHRKSGPFAFGHDSSTRERKSEPYCTDIERRWLDYISLLTSPVFVLSYTKGIEKPALICLRLREHSYDLRFGCLRHASFVLSIHSPLSRPSCLLNKTLSLLSKLEEQTFFPRPIRLNFSGEFRLATAHTPYLTTITSFRRTVEVYGKFVGALGSDGKLQP